ncbi:MAG: DUF819 family protein [Bacteroidetes bacterium]|nr:MAG: DUF819 family protein [Bacteroidota bacterium]
MRLLDSVEVNKINLEKYLIVNYSQTEEIEVVPGQKIFIDFTLSDVPLVYDSVIYEWGGVRLGSKELVPFEIVADDNENSVSVYVTEGKKEVNLRSGAKGFDLKQKVTPNEPWFSSDKLVFGILTVLLALVFYTSSLQNKFWKKFYMIVPSLLLCYLLPALFNSLGIISKDYSSLYNVAKDYLLPAALILMTIGIDFKAVVNLGPKAIIMFLTATVGIILGGPVAILVFSWIDPSVVGGEGYDAAWRGFSTLAGSWIGGGANQAAMLETYKYNPDLYGKMVTVDIVVANLWMAFLLWGAARTEKFDKWLKADTSSIEELKQKVSNYQLSIARNPSLTDYMVILGVAFGIVSVSHFFGEDLAIFFENSFGPESPFASSFFWLVVISTTGGLLLSLTKLRSYEGAGASKLGSVFIYILVATIGMKMELHEAIKEPMLIVVGIVWMLVHVGILFLVGKLIRAPFFFIAVGSKANVGGAASAPIVAAAFHPSLASVGAILAVLGYALGTYGAIISAELMRFVAP